MPAYEATFDLSELSDKAFKQWCEKVEWFDGHAVAFSCSMKIANARETSRRRTGGKAVPSLMLFDDWSDYDVASASKLLGGWYGSDICDEVDRFSAKLGVALAMEMETRLFRSSDPRNQVPYEERRDNGPE